jgi:hypothetical protein
MLNELWNIERIWVAEGRITQVQFSIVFSDIGSPGMASTHNGNVSIVDANLDAAATKDQTVQAIRDFYGPDWAQLETFHALNLAFEYEQAQSTPIDVNPPADPDNGFPPLEPLDFWLIALEIGVTEETCAATIAAMPEDTQEQVLAKGSARIYLTKAKRFRRNDPVLNQLAEAQGVTQAQLDHMWIWGAPSAEAA